MDTHTNIYRMLDASANRAREGLRVIEDFARFNLNDAYLVRSLKQFRHDLTAIVCQFPADALLASRDTIHDVGTEIGTAAEYHRTSALDVVRAAFKRVQEAMRTLEEFSKVTDPLLAPRFEKMRYQLYTLEKVVIRTDSARARLIGQQLYLLVTGDQCRLGFEAVVQKSLEAGVRIFQLREKTLVDRDLVERARQLREWTRAAGALLIINDRPEIALLADADGVHVGQTELSVSDARSIVGPDRIVGVSTHSIEQARQAVLDGADYLGVGPTFPSGTKSFVEFPGLAFVSQVAAEITLPWFAIGGIDTENISQVVAAGASRVAISGAVLRSVCPDEVIVRMLSTFPEGTAHA